ncbi:DUF547 domain-containing protein [Dissulfurirhabdus thermomarina]|uniref:DUF547 domain-containing protein n=1 Tax=Dissulfurirhabdus thermomarina TaxID=1765737 RepID=A0A6N9TMD7_DISTH|nr:glycoside hydrolase family 15 protein [Dissulfurirhabdus thermomarina]NDY42289.1 DUF547 domain-containing protein [Dissulfurirhabdus thermomarina]NMX23041.1 DUF547 domain-containing protein [Dissulfurirhabdus thermomarina]
MTYHPIETYGAIGNLHTIALVGPDGSIDWLPAPHLDAPGVFAAILDDEKGGRFRIAPTAPFDTAARYLAGTNILVTAFRTRAGEAELTDFMPVDEDGGGRPPSRLLRRLECTRGEIEVEAFFEPRFDYARAATRVRLEAPGRLAAEGGGGRLDLATPFPMEIEGAGARGRAVLRRGDVLWWGLDYGPGPAPPAPEACERCLEATRNFWRRWLETRETGRRPWFGPWTPLMERSALVLKLLQFRPSGAVAAAATTSLPEEIGGGRNWDYRFTWIRDASLTLQALYELGHLEEMERYFGWIEERFKHRSARDLRIMYGLRGEEDLREDVLGHLEGYKGSAPVRIGNAAAGQQQMDIYGEILDAALRLSNYAGKIRPDLWPFLRSVCDHVAAHWREPDSGIWEVRGPPAHFVHSKVMCWVAMDRGLTIARRYGFACDRRAWAATRDAIRDEVLRRGWNPARGAFVQRYESDTLDAACLRLPLVGFLPFDDPRVRATVEAVQAELAADGLLYRYKGGDGLPGGEGAFLLCTCWLAQCLAGLGRLEEAEETLRRVAALAGPLGLFSEEYDPAWRQALGNYPQAFTHIGLVIGVAALRRAQGRAEVRLERPRPRRPGRLGRPLVLNASGESCPLDTSALAARLMRHLNILRGAFFDTARGRVAYEEMRGSPEYRDYLDLACGLSAFDPSALETPEARKAFWINLYNVLVIHGVIELGIRDSVKEVPAFFRKIRYRVGPHTLSPDHIEHGILRGNRRRPGGLFRPFGRRDPRRALALAPLDPRIHFALVCASSSCPPIEVYTAEHLDHQLELAAETFVNGEGLRFDPARDTLFLSRVFRWYARDFGDRPEDRIRFLAAYVRDGDLAARMRETPGGFRLRYLPYDWRLNRT